MTSSARLRLWPVCAEQAVPPGQIEAEIAVGLIAPQHRMVHAVHVGRHHQQAHDPVEPARHRGIGMIEHRGRVEHDLELRRPRPRGTPTSTTTAILISIERHDLDRMEAQAGGSRRYRGRRDASGAAATAPMTLWNADMLRVDRKIERKTEAEIQQPPPARGGHGVMFKRPQPRCAAITATPTAATGIAAAPAARRAPECRDCPASARARPTLQRPARRRTPPTAPWRQRRRKAARCG